MEEPNASKSAQFVNELAQFYRNKGQFGVTSKHMTVRLDGQDVDLWELYSSVLEFGGSYKVNQHSLWEEVYIKVFRRKPSGVNTSVALRQIYQRFLMPYERVHCSNFVHDNGNDDEDDSKSAFQTNKDLNNSFVIHSSLTPHPQSHQQHLQQHLASSTANPVTKVICSLVSGLSNEMDFGLKTVTMLVNSRQFNSIADYRFIDILLECLNLNVCNCDHESLPLTPLVSPSKRYQRHRSLHETESSHRLSRQLHSSSSSSTSSPTKKCLCFQRLWSRLSPDPSVLGLIFEDNLDQFSPSIEEGTSILSSEDHFNQSEEQEKQSNLIKRIADLIRSITEFMQESQESEEDLESEGCPLRLLKFTVLLMSSHDIEMKSLGLEIASNVTLNSTASSETDLYISLETYVCTRSIALVFDEQDVDIVSRSLRCLSHLLSSSTDDNIKTYKDCFDTSFLNRLIELLTCQHDVTLLVSALELCWSISEVSPKLLLSSNCSHLIKILLNLINCDIATHFGIDALKRIKLSDTHVRSLNQVTRVIVNQQPTQANSINVGKPIIVAAQPNASQTNASESEAFLMTWLRNTFDLTSGKTGQVISINDMFAAYIKFACNSGRRSVINAQSFSQVILKAFPSVTVNGIQVEGIIPKVTTVHFVPPSVPGSSNPGTMSAPVSSTPKKAEIIESDKNPLTSPILKAHLSAPPKTSPSGQPSPIPSATTSLCTTTAGTTPTSSLIKSLLATKLRNNSVNTKLDFGDSSSDPSSPVTTKKEPEVKIDGQTAVSTVLVNPQPSVTVTTSSGPVFPTTPQKVTLSSVMTHNQNLMITTTPNSGAIPQAVLNSSSQPVLISTNTMSNSGTPGQPQQFILVRMTGAGGQQQLVGMPTGGPVRFILPASALAQQRPVVNGVVNSPQAVVVPTTVAQKISPVITPNNATAVNTHQKASTGGGDILLKAVLGSGIVPQGSEAQSTVTPTKAKVDDTAKSSPLLNVLLDKGTSSSTSASQASPVSGQQQHPQKMLCILTTNPGVAIKPPSCTESIQVGLKNGSPSETVNHVIQKNVVSPSVSLTVNCSDGHALTNGVTDELCLDEKKLVSSNDLSPIKDIQKAMDDATKQISQKRTKEDKGKTPKKIKVSLKEPTKEVVTVTPINKPVNGDMKTPPKTSPNSVTNVAETKPSNPVPSVQPMVVTAAPPNVHPTNGHILPVLAPSAPAVVPKLEFVCEWNGCKMSFPKPNQVFTHVYNSHVFINCTAKTSKTNDILSCEWGGPHGMGPGCQSKRPRLSLLTHLQDFHCNASLLHQTAVKRIQLGAPTTVNVSLSQPPPAHPGYAKNAALLAIKRHAVNYIEPWPTLGQTPTAPVTVSVRLTAALIIRNLASLSGDVRRWLQRHESYLSELTMNFGRDESRTIAQCLAIIQSSGWKRKDK